MTPEERLSPEIEDRDLSAGQIDDLVAFLQSLTDVPPVTVPDRVPSGLPPAGIEPR